MIYDYLLAAGVAGIGLSIGWWLRGVLFPRSAAPSTETSAPPEKTEPSADAVQAREVLKKLHELAAHVAADVGAHTKNVQKINADLRGPGTENASDVFAAVDRLISVNEQMQNQLRSAENRLAEQARELEEQSAAALTDALTGLANRRSLDIEMKRRSAEAERQGRRYSLMMIDVDHFKKFNDTHGHQAGDAVLKNVGRVLAAAAREMDFVARYGGEEFAVLFPGTTIDEARKAAERMRAAISDSVCEFNGITLRVTSSAGLAQLKPGESGEALLKRADDTLYLAKKAGRDRGYYHDGAASFPLIDPPVAAPEPVATTAANPVVAPLATAKPATASTTVSASTQDLVNLASRMAFCEDVQRRVAEWKRGGATVAVALLQIDNYPAFVAQHDPSLVDLLLRATVQFTKASMRDMDHMARFDDATFALLLPGSNLQSSSRVAERLRTAVEKASLKHEGSTVRFTISCGVAEVSDSDDSEKMIRRAENALDSAAKAGGNRSFCDHGGACHAIAGTSPAKVGA